MTCKCGAVIDELMEAYILDKGLEITVTGCQKCVDGLVQRIEQMEKAATN